MIHSPHLPTTGCVCSVRHMHIISFDYESKPNAPFLLIIMQISGDLETVHRFEYSCRPSGLPSETKQAQISTIPFWFYSYMFTSWQLLSNTFSTVSNSYLMRGFDWMRSEREGLRVQRVVQEDIKISETSVRLRLWRIKVEMCLVKIYSDQSDTCTGSLAYSFMGYSL